MDDYEQEVNYYRSSMNSVGGLKYRLDGEDVITRAIDTLRGGVRASKGGRKEYFSEFRCMNDLGIQRARMVIESGVNKINHLTKYTDKEMIFRQIRSVIRAWIFEVTLNAKMWAPEAKFVKGRLINDDFCKVRNKRLIIQTIENALLQSMLRGTGGFEAELTSKQFSVHELTDNREGATPPRGGFLSGMFGRRNEGGGDYRG